MAKYPDETCLIYSMWSGYLEHSGMKQLFDRAGKNRRIIHSSGHVTLNDLNEFIDTIKPNRIVVIHTDTDIMEGLEKKQIVLSVRDEMPFFI